jgi:quercetin dioxygenase-like cupin family protein
MVPGLTREYAAGAVAPMHSHEHEQISYVVRGHLRGLIGGKPVELRDGQVALIPPHVPHRFEAVIDTLEIDFFTPVRQDWMAGDNGYFDRANSKLLDTEAARAAKSGHSPE